MPISIKSLVVGKEEIAIPFGDETLNLTYDPNKFTVDLEERVRNASDDEGAIASVANLIAELIVDWDAVDNGQPIPVSAAVLGGLGLGVLRRIMEAIGDNQNPNARDASSANGSRRTAASARARNGTH